MKKRGCIGRHYPLPPPRVATGQVHPHSGPFWEWLTSYYASPEWQEVRRKVLATAKRGRCACCNKRPATDAHHTTYCRVGHERWGDVVPLCHECHQDMHDHDIDG